MKRWIREGKLGYNIDGVTKRPTYISNKVGSKMKVELIEVLKEYRDCFAWNYDEIPGLDRSMVEH